MSGHLSFRARILLLVLVVAVIPLAIVGLWLARAPSRSGEALLAQRVARALDATVEETVSNWIEWRSRVLRLAEAPGLARALLDGPPAGGAEREAGAANGPRARILIDTAGPEILLTHFRELGPAVPALVVYDRDGGPRWSLGRSPDGEVSWQSVDAVARTRDVGAVAYRVAVWDGLSDRRLGTVEVLLDQQALLPLTSVPPEAAGMVIGLFDATGRRSLRPVPFDPALLWQEEFRWGGDLWVTRRRSLGDPPVIVIAASPASSVVGPFQEAARQGGRVLLATALLGLLAAAALSRRLTRSLERLSDAAQAVAAGDFERRIDENGHDEVAQVGEAFNVMAESLKETLGELAAKESLAAVGEFAASLAHEVRNPLTVIRVDLQKTLAGLPPESELRPRLERSLSEIEHLDSTIGDTLAQARIGRPGAGTVDLGEVLRSAASAAHPFYEERRATLALDSGGIHIYVRGDSDTLRQAFLNLFRNAAEALGPRGRTDVVLETDGDTVEVTVVDNGAGIPTELQERIFEPLFTTRSEGTGLGLTIVKRIVEAHGGTVAVQSEPGAGTRVKVRLPGM